VGDILARRPEVFDRLGQHGVQVMKQHAAGGSGAGGSGAGGSGAGAGGFVESSVWERSSTQIDEEYSNLDEDHGASPGSQVYTRPNEGVHSLPVMITCITYLHPLASFPLIL
jgi:hypothetical protein